MHPLFVQVSSGSVKAKFETIKKSRIFSQNGIPAVRDQNPTVSIIRRVVRTDRNYGIRLTT